MKVQLANSVMIFAVSLALLGAVTTMSRRITELERRNARDDGSAKRVEDTIDRIREIGNRPSRVDTTDVFGTAEHGKKMQSKIDQAKGK